MDSNQSPSRRSTAIGSARSAHTGTVASNQPGMISGSEMPAMPMARCAQSCSARQLSKYSGVPGSWACQAAAASPSSSVTGGRPSKLSKST